MKNFSVTMGGKLMKEITDPKTLKETEHGPGSYEITCWPENAMMQKFANVIFGTILPRF